MMVREWEGDRPKRVDRLPVHRPDGICFFLSSSFSFPFHLTRCSYGGSIVPFAPLPALPSCPNCYVPMYPATTTSLKSGGNLNPGRGPGRRSVQGLSLQRFLRNAVTNALFVETEGGSDIIDHQQGILLVELPTFGAFLGM